MNSGGYIFSEKRPVWFVFRRAVFSLLMASNSLLSWMQLFYNEYIVVRAAVPCIFVLGRKICLL